MHQRAGGVYEAEESWTRRNKKQPEDADSGATGMATVPEAVAHRWRKKFQEFS